MGEWNRMYVVCGRGRWVWSVAVVCIVYWFGVCWVGAVVCGGMWSVCGFLVYVCGLKCMWGYSPDGWMLCGLRCMCDVCSVVYVERVGL